ncbi:lipoyl synthase [Lactococcus termiticola]|nr:lipoyl synthase [Lactococcus termiticola]
MTENCACGHGGCCCGKKSSRPEVKISLIDTAPKAQVKPRVRFKAGAVDEVKQLMENAGLNTVCAEASCPNMAECFANGTATFMILGSHCSRNCRFCDVTFGGMEPVDVDEPAHVAEAAYKMGLNHVVITCVARDDLPDGGAFQFVRTIKAVREKLPEATIEVLISDMKGEQKSLDRIIKAKPDIINHNIETVKRLTPQIRHRATYQRTLDVLAYCKAKAPEIFTKTGIILGLGEKREEVDQLMEDTRAVGVDFLTIGQYLQPSERHFQIREYISLADFADYRKLALSKGFKFVASGPQVRSSYKAHEALQVGVK